MNKRTIPSLLLLLSFILVQGCSTGSDDPAPTSSNTPSSDIKKDESAANAKKNSLNIRNAITERLKLKGLQERFAVSVLLIVSTMFSVSGRIVAVETVPLMVANSSLIYFVVYDLEDKDGNTYPHAKFLTGMNASVVYLMKNKLPPSSEPEEE